MKVGVIADTHDNMPMIRRAMEMFKAHDVKCMIHAGDYVAPFALKELQKPGIKIIGVFGNNDGENRVLKNFAARCMRHRSCSNLTAGTSL